MSHRFVVVQCCLNMGALLISMCGPCVRCPEGGDFVGYSNRGGSLGGADVTKFESVAGRSSGGDTGLSRGR